MIDYNQAQVIRGLTSLRQLLSEYDKVGEATSLVRSITRMLEAPLLDLKCVRLRRRLDILEVHLKDLPMVVTQAYAKVQADIQRLLSISMKPSLRTLRMEKVKDSLRSLNVFDMCVYTLRQKGILVGTSKIGKGGYGKVYKGTIAGVPTVLKTVRLDESGDGIDTYEARKVLGEDLTALPIDYQPLEYRFGLTLNDLVLTDQCPNFMLTYDMGICRDETAIYFLEEASFDLAEAFRQRFFGPMSQVSLLAQLLIALYYVHTRLEAAHKDVKAENILLLETPSLARTLMSYEVDGRTFVIENTGVILCLADFGVADSRRSGFAIDISNCLATFLGGLYDRGYEHQGYYDLSAPLKQALRTAYSLRFDNSLDALAFVLQSVKYTPSADLPVSRVFKSATQLERWALDLAGVTSTRALVKAAMKGLPEVVEQLAGQASQADLNLALIAAAVKGDTDTIDVLIEKGADNYEALVVTLVMVTKKIGEYMRYLPPYYDLSSFIPLILVSFQMAGIDLILGELIRRNLKDQEDLNKLLVAAGLKGSPEVAKVLLDEGATNLDQALRAANLTENREVARLLKSRGAQEGGAYPTLPAGSLAVFETLDTLWREYGLDNDRAWYLVNKVWNDVKGYEVP